MCQQRCALLSSTHSYLYVEAPVWKVLKDEASLAFTEWKTSNPYQKLDDKAFFMVGEVFHFGLYGFNNSVKGTRLYDYGDRPVDFVDNGFDSHINRGFATHAARPMKELFFTYSDELHKRPFKGVGTMNYVVSHDDPEPCDCERKDPYNTALKLMLAPGAAQIYHGDELARGLTIEGAYGDGHWRSFMNWQDLENEATQKLLAHWQKLGHFRHNNLSLGAGVHKMHNERPYIFSRRLETDKIKNTSLIAVNADLGKQSLNVYDSFPDGTRLVYYYSGQQAIVQEGQVSVDTPFSTVLFAVQRSRH